MSRVLEVLIIYNKGDKSGRNAEAAACFVAALTHKDHLGERMARGLQPGLQRPVPHGAQEGVGPGRGGVLGQVSEVWCCQSALEGWVASHRRFPRRLVPRGPMVRCRLLFQLSGVDPPGGTGEETTGKLSAKRLEFFF